VTVARADVVAQIESERLIAIVRLADPGDAVAAVEAIAAGGVAVCEISLATEGALGAIAAAAGRGDAMLVGAGTVTSVALAEAAVAAGARYLVGPTLDADVGAWAEARDIFYLPGAFSPAEIVAAAKVSPLVKLFPAGGLGPRYVKDLLAPFPRLRLVPTGGVDSGNAAEFLAAGAAAVAVGSALVNEDSARDPSRLAEAARALRLALVRA
jgi:2-dehydro-3-deoxyphosphogluconate aldolase/(4S)-4-hydroxy-2-oxoglutarate aldolase